MSTTTDQRSAAAATGADETPLRFVTAASLFDGHDAAINVMRRLIQDSGAEVVHLGHNRSVRDVVRAAIQEDVDGIAISSYQGGHTEYFKYAVEMLGERGAGHIRVFGGGGGTITPAEIAELQGYGVERIYHPNDGMNARPGRDDRRPRRARPRRAGRLGAARGAVATTTSASRGCSRRSRTASSPRPTSTACAPSGRWPGTGVPVVGVTGTGGAGKSTVTDELLSPLRRSTSPTCGSRCSRSTRPGGAPAAPCSATGSG